MTRRLYSTSDIRMLTACDVIADHALENLEPLVAYNPAWSADYFTAIKTDIAGILQNVFGIRSVNTLKEITARLNATREQVLNHLTMLHRQINTAWRTDPAILRAILTALGYTANWAGAKNNGSLADLLTLLETFAKACTEGLLAKLQSKKVSITSINFVCDNIKPLYELNVTQEGTKDSRKLITAEIVTRFNAIYTDTMFYAGSAQILFKADAVRVKEFTFTHIVRGLGGGRSGSSAGSSDDAGNTTE
jgi:hypothetical protein